MGGRRAWVASPALMLLTLAAATASGDGRSAAGTLLHSGFVGGTLACAEASTALPPALVHLEGASFAARPDTRGAFTLSYVPEGNYVLAVEIEGKARLKLGVLVRRNQVTEVGTVVIDCVAGGPCTANPDCSGGEYCAAAVGACGAPGECKPRPSACPDVWDPVCGCDGVTYGNRCDAEAAGVSLSALGECPR